MEAGLEPVEDSWEAGRELVEASHLRVSIRELGAAILPRASTREEEEVSTQEAEEFLPRVNIRVEEEEVPPLDCLPPAPGQLESP